MTKEMLPENLYFAEIDRFDKNGLCEGGWGFYVNPERCGAFTVEFAKELLEWGTKEYKTRFHKDVDFNCIKLKMGNKVGKYHRDKNRLIIFQNGFPIYENFNGEICRDSVALADSLL